MTSVTTKRATRRSSRANKAKGALIRKGDRRELLFSPESSEAPALAEDEDPESVFKRLLKAEIENYHTIKTLPEDYTCQYDHLDTDDRIQPLSIAAFGAPKIRSRESKRIPDPVFCFILRPRRIATARRRA